MGQISWISIEGVTVNTNEENYLWVTIFVIAKTGTAYNDVVVTSQQCHDQWHSY